MRNSNIDIHFNTVYGTQHYPEPDGDSDAGADFHPDTGTKFYAFAFVDAIGNVHTLSGKYGVAESHYDPDTGTLSVVFYDSEGDEFIYAAGNGWE